MPIRVVFLDQATLPVALLPFHFAHRLEVYPQTTSAQVAERIAEAHIVLTNKVALEKQHLEAAPHLKIIGVPAVGLDHLDQKTCAARGIQIFNAAGYASEGVAEHALMLMLVLRRRLFEYQRAAQDGTWSASPLFCHFGTPFDDLGAQTLGLIGSGGIGQALARMAQGLGMNVLFAERRSATKIRTGYTDFETVLATADVLSLHAPLNAETAQMINADALARMKETAILINTGRGGLVDEAALVQALEQGRIAAAGLDVLGTEPPPKDHPLLKYRGDNLLLTPHSAWIGNDSLARIVQILHGKIEAAMSAQ